MGLFSAIKEARDQINEQNRISAIQDFESKRQKLRKDIDKFLNQSLHTVGGKSVMKLPETLGTTDVDELLMEYAPKLSWMLTELYLCKEESMRLHELEGRYKELKEHYEELQVAYEKQNEILATLAQKA